MEDNGKWWTAFISRKFLVLAIATVMLWYGKISDDIWMYIALAYIGVNVVQRYIDQRTETRRKSEEIHGSEITVGPGEKP